MFAESLAFMKSVKNKIFRLFLDAKWEYFGHRRQASREQQSHFAFENEVQVLVLVALLEHMIAPGEFLFQEMNFELLERL